LIDLRLPDASAEVSSAGAVDRLCSIHFFATTFIRLHLQQHHRHMGLAVGIQWYLFTSCFVAK